MSRESLSDWLDNERERREEQASANAALEAAGRSIQDAAWVAGAADNPRKLAFDFDEWRDADMFSDDDLKLHDDAEEAAELLTNAGVVPDVYQNWRRQFVMNGIMKPKFGWVFRTMIAKAYSVPYEDKRELAPDSSPWAVQRTDTGTYRFPGARIYYIVGTDGHMYSKRAGRGHNGFALGHESYEINKVGLVGRTALQTGKLGRNTNFLNIDPNTPYLRGYLKEYLATNLLEDQ
jgi:hypothetical protein